MEKTKFLPSPYQVNDGQQNNSTGKCFSKSMIKEELYYQVNFSYFYLYITKHPKPKFELQYIVMIDILYYLEYEIIL